MRADGIFIAVEVDDDTLGTHPELPAHLTQVCPVDIYREAEGGGLQLVDDNLDECVLCGLCLAKSAGAVKVIKLYDDGAVLEPAT
jgi:ferredoxin-like protein FixX